jgi:serine/threonine protein kinase/tetratricopeptide (TPR) repeat protein
VPPSLQTPPVGIGSTPPIGGAPATGFSQEGPLAVGQSFGARYHIIRCLGVGGMGAVYQAWDAELGVAVALKVIRPEIAEDPIAAAEIERRFKRELLLARQITHPNIIRIHDLGDIGGIKYITMPFIDGEDLASVLKEQKKLPVPRALKIAKGTVSGLVSAHQAGVIHRDLKPANIMIGTDETPTIMDFGIARAADGSTQGQSPPPRGIGVRPAELSRTAAAAASSTVAGAIVGTVAYMAPEQARGEAVDQRADIYAFGLIMYDMLIGGRRSERATSAIAELKERMEHAPPTPRSIDPTIPEPVDAIIRKCLEPDLTKRFQTTVELQEALGRLDDNGKPLPIMKRVSRRTMIAAAVVVVALLGGTYYTANWFATPLKEPDPVSVVIADFQNNTNDPTFTKALAPVVIRALEDASFISAYDRTRISQALGVRPPEKLDEVAARELAVKQGVGVVFAGAISSKGSSYDISVKAVHPVTGEEIANVSGTASDKNQVLETATRLVARVRRALGDRKSQSDQLFAMRTISTTSLEVVSHYAAAVEAQSRGNFEEAETSYQQALKLDPSFGLAYQGLAAMSRNLGKVEDSEKYSKEAIRFLDKMTERERFSARAYYYRTINDTRECAREYGELLARYPADAVAHSQRAICLASLNQTREAVDEIRRAVELVPNHMVYRINLAVLANAAGEFETVDEQIKAMPKQDPRAMIALAYSQIARGMVKEATATYEAAIPMNPRIGTYAVAGLGDVRIFQGEYSSAATFLTDAAAKDLEAKRTDEAALKLTSKAYAQLMTNQRGNAIATATQALEHSQATSVRFLAARILIEAGAAEKAQPLIKALAAEPDLSGSSQAHAKILEGLMALNDKRPQDAIKILTDANSVLDTWFGHFDRGRALFEAKSFVQADSEFDLCVTRRGEAISLMGEGPTYGYFPPVYYYQGRVRQELNTASFADSYREYLKIRGASTEDPLARDVRKRIGN